MLRNMPRARAAIAVGFYSSLALALSLGCRYIANAEVGATHRRLPEAGEFLAWTMATVFLSYAVTIVVASFVVLRRKPQRGLLEQRAGQFLLTVENGIPQTVSLTQFGDDSLPATISLWASQAGRWNILVSQRAVWLSNRKIAPL